jgi:hypothetical protein
MFLEELKVFLINISQGGFIMVKSMIFPFFLARATFIVLKEQSLVALKRLVLLVLIFFLLYYTSASLIGFTLDLANELGSIGFDTLKDSATKKLSTDQSYLLFSGEILKRVVSAIISFIYIFLDLVSYILATLVAIILPIGLALEICVGLGGPILSAVSAFGTVFLYIVFFTSILEKIRVQGFMKLSSGGEITLYDLLTELVIVVIFIGSTIYVLIKNKELSTYVNKPLDKVKGLAQESASGVKRASGRSYAHVNDKYKVNQRFENSIGTKLRKSSAYKSVLRPLAKGGSATIKTAKTFKKHTQNKIQDTVNLFKENPDFEFGKNNKIVNPITKAFQKQYVQNPSDQMYKFNLSENKAVEIKGRKKAENFNKMVQKNQLKKAYKNVDNIDIKQAELTPIDKKSISQQLNQQNTSLENLRVRQFHKRRQQIIKVAQVQAVKNKQNIQISNLNNIKKS